MILPRPRMVHRPYLQITLSTQPLGLEVGPKGRNVTCQYVMVRRRKPRSNTKINAVDPGSEESGPLPAAAGSVAAEVRGAAEEAEQVAKMGEKAIKRKAGSSQSDTIRGGKKRKK